MPTKTLSNMSAEELAAELARKQQAQAAEQAERAQRIEDARKAWAEATWTSHADREEDLKAKGEGAREAFSQAVRVSDLSAAFAAWIDERSARYAQESARNKTKAAAGILGERIDHIPDLRWYDPDFLRRLEEEADKQARANGYDLADELVPDAPTEVQ